MVLKNIHKKVKEVSVDYYTDPPVHGVCGKGSILSPSYSKQPIRRSLTRLIRGHELAMTSGRVSVHAGYLQHLGTTQCAVSFLPPPISSSHPSSSVGIYGTVGGTVGRQVCQVC